MTSIRGMGRRRYFEQLGYDRLFEISVPAILGTDGDALPAGLHFELLGGENVHRRSAVGLLMLYKTKRTSCDIRIHL